VRNLNEAYNAFDALPKARFTFIMQTDRQTDRPADRQTVRQTDTYDLRTWPSHKPVQDIRQCGDSACSCANVFESEIHF